MTIPEILQHFNIETAPDGHHHATAGWLNVDCPWCSARSNRFRLGINLFKGFGSCWTCGGHRLPDVIVESAGVSLKEALAACRNLDVTTPLQTVKPTGKLCLPAGLIPLQTPHSAYLARRGLGSRKISRLWQLQGLGLEAGFLAWRIFIPVIFEGRVVSWTTRSLSDKVDKRYWSAKPAQEEVSHKDLLFGEDLVKNTIIIVEGPLDAMSIGPGGVATCGTSYTKAQLLRMTKYAVRGVCFDNQPEAQRRARVLCDELEGFDGDTYNIVLKGKDANDTLVRYPKEIRKLRKRFLS